MRGSDYPQVRLSHHAGLSIMLCVPLLFGSVRARSVSDCRAVPIVPDAIALSSDISLGSRVQYNCTKGYEHTGQSTMNRCVTAGWSDDVICSQIEIPCTPQSVANGEVKVSGHSYADFIYYTCNELTTTQGETYGQCKKDGQWTISPPKCLAHCQEYRLESGNNHVKSLSELGNDSHGSKIQLSCNHRYQLSPWCRDALVTCNNGTWTGCTASTCQPRPCTYSVADGEESSVRGDDGTIYDESTPIPTGTTVTILCRSGYEGGGDATCQYGDFRKETPCEEMVTATGILSQFPPGIEDCVSHRYRAQAVKKLADLLFVRCGSDIASLDTCVANVIRRELGDACGYVRSWNLSSHLEIRMKHFMTTRQWIPYRTIPSNYTLGSQVTCRDMRQHGPLCSLWKPDTLTASNTRCREGHYCGTHGYSYSWCYTSHHWEYCCTGACGYGRGTHYRWCWAEYDSWAYCSI